MFSKVNDMTTHWKILKTLYLNFNIIFIKCRRKPEEAFMMFFCQIHSLSDKPIISFKENHAENEHSSSIIGDLYCSVGGNRSPKETFIIRLPHFL
jgi:hypothetical protein